NGSSTEPVNAPINPPRKRSRKTPSNPPSVSLAVSYLEVKASVAVPKELVWSKTAKTMTQKTITITIFPKYSGFRELAKTAKTKLITTKKSKVRLMESGIEKSNATE